MLKNPSTWGRWHWSTGLGRWHAIVGTEGEATALACGRTRRPPKVTAGRPGDEKCCPTCAKLDDLRTAYLTDQKPVDAVATQPVAVPAGAAS